MLPNFARVLGKATQLPDADLIHLFQLTSTPAAIHELLDRHYPAVLKMILRESKRVGLKYPDREDAQQEAIFAFWNAVFKFDRRLNHHSSAGFRSFLKLVVTARFRDYLRRLQRREARYDRSVHPDDLEAIHENKHGVDHPDDPLTRLSWQELTASLEQSVANLPPRARQLWDQLATGKSLREATEALDISYAQGKRMRQRILAEFATKLSAWKG